MGIDRRFADSDNRPRYHFLELDGCLKASITCTTVFFRQRFVQVALGRRPLSMADRSTLY